MATPVPKTLRVVNSVTADNTPAPLAANAETPAKDDSYFGLIFPPRAISTAASSVHRRSVSLGPHPIEDPFVNPRDERVSDVRGLPTGVRPSTGTKHTRNFSRVQITRPTSSIYGTQRNTQVSSMLDADASSAASQAPGNVALPTEASRAQPQPQTQSTHPPDASSIPDVASQNLDRNSSVASTAEVSILRQRPDFASSHEASPVISPITDPTTISRNTSDASNATQFQKFGQITPGTAELRHASYDPFNYNGPKRGSMVATTLLVRNASTNSKRTTSTNSEGAFFLDSDSMLGYGEPGPTRPVTQYTSSLLTPGTRRTRAVSNDPFDLDRPEVLGYTPGAMKTRFDTGRRSGNLERSDSSASRGSVAGRTRTRRRSSVQEWSYIDAARNSPP